MEVNWAREELDESTVIERTQQLISEGQEVMSLDISGNLLTSANELINVLCHSNLAKTIKILNLSGNKLQEFKVNGMSGLFSLDLSFNEGLSSVELSHVSGLRAVDLRGCALSGDSLYKLLRCEGFTPKNLRLSGNNNIIDQDIEMLVKDTEIEQTLSGLTSLDLRNTGTTEYINLSNVKELLPNTKKPTGPLHALKPVSASSRRSSAKPLPKMKPLTVDEQLEEVLENKNYNIDSPPDYAWPEAIIELLIGSKYKIYNHIPQICANQTVCAALAAGCAAQPDLEEMLANGFARRFGTVLCKVRGGGAHTCKARCSAILELVKQKTAELNAAAGREEPDLVVQGVSKQPAYADVIGE